ncbi:MAG: hypothetical protein AB7U76_24995 [Pirellulales bacterium]
MSTEFVSGGDAAQSESFDSSGMTAAEAEFYRTEPEPAATPVAQPETSVEVSPAAPEADAPSDDEPSEDGEITIDANGNAKDTKTGRFVPKSAFLRVKGEAKELKGETAKLREALIQSRERLAILTEANAPAQKAPEVDLADEPDIDPEEDIFAAYKQQQRRLAKMQEALKTNEQRTTAQQMQSAFIQDVQSFTAKSPDFTQAFAHLVAQRHAALEALGVEDKAQRDTMIQTEARDLVNETIKAGKSPAERIYKLASAMGYKAAAPKTDALTKAAEQIERLENGQRQTVSLKGAGGGGVQEQLTAAKYASMGDDEALAARASYIAKHGEGAWRRLLGG